MKQFRTLTELFAEFRTNKKVGLAVRSQFFAAENISKENLKNDLMNDGLLNEEKVVKIKWEVLRDLITENKPYNELSLGIGYVALYPEDLLQLGNEMNHLEQQGVVKKKFGTYAYLFFDWTYSESVLNELETKFTSKCVKEILEKEIGEQNFGYLAYDGFVRHFGSELYLEQHVRNLVVKNLGQLKLQPQS